MDSTEAQLDEVDLAKSYGRSSALFENLRGEVEFSITDAVGKTGVKLHSIDSRTKKLASIQQKARDKGIKNPLQEITDIVGCRVVCLFKEDISVIQEAISTIFDIVSTDDKSINPESALGYNSIHLICKIPEHYSGPRYRDLSGRYFEVQLRTLCMHCWAAVSHYLDYKGDWDVPKDLKASLNALSGLFYVADNEFSRFSASRKLAIAELDGAHDTASTEINFDTVSKLLRSAFSDRRASGPTSVSNLVQELKQAGYKSLAEVHTDALRARRAAIQYESDVGVRSEDGKFLDTGLMRTALRLANKKFGPSSAKTKTKLVDYEKFLD